MEMNDQLHAPADLPLGKEHSFDRKEGGWATEADWTLVRGTTPHLSDLG